jgi:hypothetical protein
MLLLVLACSTVSVESTAAVQASDPSVLTVTGAEPGTLVVTHAEDLFFDCCPSVDVSAYLSGDDVTLDARFELGACQCVGGPKGYSATLVGLPSGADLTLHSGSLSAEATVP